jgi:hypothetical protein
VKRAFQVPASGSATVRVPLPAKPSSDRPPDVSREPADGNPAHSGESVLRGATLSLRLAPGPHLPEDAVPILRKPT